MRIIKLLFITLSIALYANSNTDIYSQPYVESMEKHLYEKFDYFSDIESMECNSLSNASVCRFNSKHDAHFLSIIAILVFALLLILGFIGSHPDYRSASLGMKLSEKEKNEMNARPIYWGRAIFVFVVALYMVKFIRSDDTNKIIDFSKQTLIVENREGNQLRNYSLGELKTIEVLKYIAEDYIHHELNFHFENQRINLYAGKDDLLTSIYAEILAKRLKKPVVKIMTRF